MPVSQSQSVKAYFSVYYYYISATLKACCASLKNNFVQHYTDITQPVNNQQMNWTKLLRNSSIQRACVHIFSTILNVFSIRCFAPLSSWPWALPGDADRLEHISNIPIVSPSGACCAFVFWKKNSWNRLMESAALDDWTLMNSTRCCKTGETSLL